MSRVLMAILLASCGGCSVNLQVDKRGDQSGLQSRLASLTAGKVAGPALTCLRREETRDLQVIDDTTIAFRNGRTLYINKLASACAGLDGSYALLTRSLDGELCRGDIADFADLTTRTIVGSCSLGEFIPYGPPRP